MHEFGGNKQLPACLAAAALPAPTNRRHCCSLPPPTTTLSLRRVLSNAIQGTFDANTMTVRLYSGYTVSPREFERMAGRPQSKVSRDAIA